MENLIAANKNIGTTHITNGCYRLHPVEWNVGETVGSLAAYALDTGRLPRSIHADRELLRSFQRGLIADGIPLSWLVDVPVRAPDFAATQRLVMAGGYGGNEHTLDFRPKTPIGASERASWIEMAAGPGQTAPCGPGSVDRAAFAMAMAERGLI